MLNSNTDTGETEKHAQIDPNERSIGWTCGDSLIVFRRSLWPQQADPRQYGDCGIGGDCGNIDALLPHNDSPHCLADCHKLWQFCGASWENLWYYDIWILIPDSVKARNVKRFMGKYGRRNNVLTEHSSKTK